MIRSVRHALCLGLVLVGAAGLAHGAAVPSPLPAQLTEVLHCQSSRDLLCDQLYPIGFSRDGKLAYIHIPADEAVGEYLWAFHIVDLVTDKKLESRDWQKNHSEKIQDLPTLLADKGSDFAALLSRYKIEALAKPQLQEFPLRSGAGTMTTTLADAVPAAADPATGYEIVNHHVVLRDARGRSKQIGSVRSARDSGMQMIYPPRLLGYLRSPFESRVAVVLEQTYRGYEGPPNVSSFVLIGAHLRAGFAPRPR